VYPTYTVFRSTRVIFSPGHWEKHQDLCEKDCGGVRGGISSNQSILSAASKLGERERERETQKPLAHVLVRNHQVSPMSVESFLTL